MIPQQLIWQLSILCAAFFCGNCHTSANDETRANIVTCLTLQGGDDWTDDTADRLLKWLVSNDDRLRWAAAWALGNGPTEHIPRIAEIARLQDARYRRPASMALALIVPRDSSALLPLGEMLKSKDVIERFYIRLGLTRINLDDPELRRALLLMPAHIEVWSVEGYRHYRYPMSLGGFETNEVPSLGLRSWRESVLFELGPPPDSDLPMLASLLQSKHRIVRKSALQQIGMMRSRGVPLANNVRRLLDDHDDDVRIAAMQFMKDINSYKATDQKQLALLVDASLTPDPRAARLSKLLNEATVNPKYDGDREVFYAQLADKYSADKQLKSLTAGILNDFRDDLRGDAPSRKVAVERLKGRFSNLEEADRALVILYNSYRYNRTDSLNMLARKVLGIKPLFTTQRFRIEEFPRLALATLEAEVEGGNIRALAEQGPAATPFLAAMVKSERSPLACGQLGQMGYWAVEAIPTLEQAAIKDDSSLARRAAISLRKVRPRP